MSGIQLGMFNADLTLSIPKTFRELLQRADKCIRREESNQAKRELQEPRDKARKNQEKSLEPNKKKCAESSTPVEASRFQVGLSFTLVNRITETPLFRWTTVLPDEDFTPLITSRKEIMYQIHHTRII
ncbi:hypothetical protein ACH5RR_032122 [Cinchona calisaya]|uniref:Uncharacterized protein n=1 Tax=Cinchona calisaya TaxID=153742 RepID=A0ABD2YLF7_9GENT